MPQVPPSYDQRYRVHQAVRLYVLNTSITPDYKVLVFYNSCYRVVYEGTDGKFRVEYDIQMRDLHSPSEMTERIEMFRRRRWNITFINQALERGEPYTPFHFIDDSSPENKAAMAELLRKARKRYKYES